MARQIKIEQIDDLMKEAVQELVQKTTLQWTTLVKKATPSVTNNLRGSWENDIKPFVGEVFTDVEYAEPVAYGTSLPPSWSGRYRTKPNQNTIKGYPELIGKQIATDIQNKINL